LLLRWRGLSNGLSNLDNYIILSSLCIPEIQLTIVKWDLTINLTMRCGCSNGYDSMKIICNKKRNQTISYEFLGFIKLWNQSSINEIRTLFLFFLRGEKVYMTVYVAHNIFRLFYIRTVIFEINKNVSFSSTLERPWSYRKWNYKN
jgi:hypothetical protein